jgi:hypothetical protein
MPLKRGITSIRSNVTELMKPIQSASRKKAVLTISRKNGISRRQAQFNQALAIARSQSRKK